MRNERLVDPEVLDGVRLLAEGLVLDEQLKRSIALARHGS